MPTITTKFQFYKYDTSTDGNLKFNFNTSLNDNWDRIETNVAITIYNPSITYKLGDCVLSTSDFHLYYSLINNNQNNALSDTTKWSIVDTSAVGSVKYFAGSTTPQGYLICDGSAISRTTYARLFTTIGTTYGIGDGSTTFNLPDLIDKFPQGNTTVGVEMDAALPNITGSFGVFLRSDSQTGCFYQGAGDGYNAVGSVYGGASNVGFDASLSNSIYSSSVNTVQPPALTLLPCIRY